jgi:Fic family protein
MDTFHPAYPQVPSDFGPEFDQELDGQRLRTQLEVLTDFMLFCRGINAWVSLAEIEKQTGIPQSSASSQLRHLRKKAFGSHTVDKRRRSAGQWEYFLVPNEGTRQ